VTKTADIGTVNAGDQIGFRIVVKNTSPTAPATGVPLSDPLPNGGGISWSCDAATSDAVCSIVAGPALSCTFGSLGPNASKQVHVTSPTTAVSCGTYNNTATARADNDGSTTSQQA